MGSVAGLGAGMLAALGATSWLRAATPDGALLWKAAPPGRVAVWALALAHGVPLQISTSAGLSSTDAPGTLGRLGEILRGEGGRAAVSFSFSVLVVPISILLVTGVVVALTVRASRPRDVRELARAAAVCAVVHGGLLAVGAVLAGVDLGFTGRLPGQIGLGAATGSLAVHAGPSPLAAAAIGALWGAAFPVAGGMASPGLRTLVTDEQRVVLRGWLRGAGAASGVAAGAVVAGTAYAVATGAASSPSLMVLGVVALWANAVAAVIVLAQGASVGVALDAGPFTGWERIDLVHVGVGGGAAPWAMWFGLAIPLAAGIVAGRHIARHSTLPPLRAALRTGVLWGLTLAALSLLLRVRVLSSFSVGDVRLGGGGAAIDPLVSLALGFAWGTAATWLGVLTVGGRRAGVPEPAS